MNEKEILFYSPTGEVIPNPDLRLIQLMIWFAEGSFWSAGSGQGWFEYKHGEDKATLTLVFYENHGFYLEFSSQVTSTNISLNQTGDYQHMVETYISGDPYILPTKFFVTREQTWQAVEEFCTTGNRTDAIIWGNKHEINWHYGYKD